MPSLAVGDFANANPAPLQREELNVEIQSGIVYGMTAALYGKITVEKGHLMLYYTDAYPASRLCNLQAAAPRLGLTLEPVAINALAEFDDAFATVAQSRPDALIVHGTPFTEARSRDIVAFALEQRLPTFSWQSELTRAGLLMR